MFKIRLTQKAMSIWFSRNSRWGNINIVLKNAIFCAIWDGKMTSFPSRVEPYQCGSARLHTLGWTSVNLNFLNSSYRQDKSNHALFTQWISNFHKSTIHLLLQVFSRLWYFRGKKLIQNSYLKLSTLQPIFPTGSVRFNLFILILST